MKLNKFLKIGSGFLLNFGLFFSVYYHENRYKEGFAKLSEEQVRNIKVRNYALRRNAFFMSEVPYLRKIAIDQYESNEQLKIKSRFEYFNKGIDNSKKAI